MSGVVVERKDSGVRHCDHLIHYEGNALGLDLWRPGDGLPELKRFTGAVAPDERVAVGELGGQGCADVAPAIFHW